MSVGTRLRVTALALTVLFAAAAPAAADPVADFYRGKQVVLYIGSDAGGGYDLYARVVGRHIGDHIPGKPTIIPKNIVGAGSLTQTNYVANVAPKDGTAIGAPQNIIPFEGLLHILSANGEKAQFDATKLNWIGSASRDLYLVIDWYTSKVTKFSDLKTMELVVGSSGPSTEHSTTANLFNAIFKTKFKIVTGYPGSADVMLAVQRGEVEGMSGHGYSSLMSTYSDLVKEGKIRILLQFGMERSPALKDVPFALDLVESEFDREVLRFIFTKYDILRLYFAPEGVPQERVAALRTAFDETMTDPAFLASAERAKIEIAPVSGANVQKLIQELYQSPPEVVAKARALMTGK
jgi:tripartite-type tricarboxylate transporter receptor subunit TctC